MTNQSHITPSRPPLEEDLLLVEKVKPHLPLYIVGHPWNPDQDYAVIGNPDPHLGHVALGSGHQESDEDPEQEVFDAVFNHAVNAANHLPQYISYVQYLEKLIESAPHGAFCAGMDEFGFNSDGPCGCWKSKIKEEKGK